MTDEEMADKSFFDKDFTYKLTNDARSYKDGYIDGLKAGREEAKRIIGNLYAICKDNHYPNSSVLMEQAEQFLKEFSNE